MRRTTIDVIRDATAELGYYRARRIGLTASFIAIAVTFGYFGSVIDYPALLGKLCRYVAGGVIFLAIANVVASTHDIRNTHQVIADAEADTLG